MLDDLHFADAASVEMLPALIAETGRGHLRWVLAFRPAEVDTPLLALQAALTEAADLVPVRLRPLAEPELAELVDQLGLGMSGAALAPALLQRTGGNPLFVLETLKHAWVEQHHHRLPGGGLPKPVSVERLIDTRIGRLSAGALALACLVAIASVDFTIGLAESVLGIGALQFADAFAGLEAAHVLRGVQFAHDLVFDAVLRSVPRVIAELSHAQVARWLESHDGEPARITDPWIAAALPVQALGWLAQAARQAAQMLRNAESLAFLETKVGIEVLAGLCEQAYCSQLAVVALSLDVDLDARRSQTRCDLLEGLAASPGDHCEAHLMRARLATVRFEDQAFERLKAVLQEATALGETRIAMACHLALTVVALRKGPLSEALPHAMACLGWYEARGEPLQRAELHAHLALVYARIGRLRDGMPDHAQAVAIARELGASLLLAGALDGMAMTF